MARVLGSEMSLRTLAGTTDHSQTSSENLSASNACSKRDVLVLLTVEI